MLFFNGLFLELKGLVAVLQERITPLVILGLRDLVFLAEMAHIDLPGKPFENDLGFLLAGPDSAFHKAPFGVRSPILTYSFFMREA